MSAANRAYLDFVLIDQFKRADVFDALEPVSLARREPSLPTTDKENI